LTFEFGTAAALKNPWGEDISETRLYTYNRSMEKNLTAVKC
jgi:hypothetical protein